MSQPSTLHGDGINFSFFNLLWSKSSNDEYKNGKFHRIEPSNENNNNGRSGSRRDSNKAKKRTVLRVPDTVVFLFGQPHQWYFTSNNGGPERNQTTILRKRRANITLDNIEEVFLNKAAPRGEVADHSVVAYFISANVDVAEVTNETRDSVLEASLDVCSTVVDNEVSCNIEYFNKETLHEFLQHGRKGKSGILQRFIAPHGGGRHNSQIRAIWTPKLCLLERRRTKRDLHDSRFALYERSITFDGPDVHSFSIPLRGTVLAGKVESICDEIVRHITEVAAEKSSGSIHGEMPSVSSNVVDKSFGRVARMVVNFKVDGNGKIWILWSSSIRLRNAPLDSRKGVIEFDYQNVGEMVSSQPLNMDTVVKLPSSVKLTQVPNHKAQVKLDNNLPLASCPSCNETETDEHFQAVPYKTIILHFEKTLDMLKSHRESHPSTKWPPEDRFIQAAGGVGFGSLPGQLAKENENNFLKSDSEATFVIPPVIRQIQPKIRVKGYLLYRNDTSFLHTICQVCESCFLAYAKLVSTSFLMTRPIEPYVPDKDYVKFPPNASSQDKPGRQNTKRSKAKEGPPESEDKTWEGICNNDQDCLGAKDFGNVPDLPPAILEPPKTADSQMGTSVVKDEESKDEFSSTLPTYFPNADHAKQSLGHMIKSHKMLTNSKKPEKTRVKKSPYE